MGVTIALDHYKVYKADYAMAHYKVYSVYPAIGPSERDVELRDQFSEPGFIPAIAREIKYFATPASKTRPNSSMAGDTDNLYDDPTHLTWYRLEVEKEEMTVIFHNQFDGQGQRWRIHGPVYLLVPTDKNKVPGRDESMHFLCYEVVKVIKGIEEQLTDKIFNLRDQYNKKEEVEIMKPKFFCAPVGKIYEGRQETERVDEHLACYEVGTQQGDLVDRRPVTISNQLDELLELTLRETRMLCVPSEKRDWSR